MRISSSRRGSALLIVLGMLAFMVVSAVAFAAYMRRTRLPSNYLRRATSSRELVKAALVRAIDDIDHAVNDNPHPGLGEQQCRRKDADTARYVSTNRNGWVGRVFMNSDMSNRTKNGDIPNGATHMNDTVPVMTLEGLAYVPAPLQSAARYYSRLTPTAKWHSFDFDAGRYAYFALDVSDYLDVNRMFAGQPRSSAANTRLTLSYLFEDNVQNGVSWDNLLKSSAQARQVDQDLRIDFSGSCVPLTSIADMNLVLNESAYGPFKSWFHEYYNNNGQVNNMSKSTDSENPLLMPLVTDGYFPTNDVVKTAEAYSSTWSGNGQTGDPYDLASLAAQPFDFTGRDNKPYSMEEIFTEYKSSLWVDYLSLVGMSALCDYLDPDHVPTSLAIPTVERVPMICGFKLSPMQGKIGLTREPASDNDVATLLPSGEPAPSDPPTDAGQTRQVMATVVYKLSMADFQPQGIVQAAAVFPFAHKDEKDSTSWTVDGRLAFFFTDGETSLRTGNAGDAIHLTDKTIPETQLTDNGVVNIKLVQTAASFSSPTVGNPLQGTVNDKISLTVNGTQALNGLASANFLTVKYTWTQSAKSKGSFGGEEEFEWAPLFTDSSVKDQISNCQITLGMPILNTDGSIKYKKGQVWQGQLPLSNFRFNAALWLRVRDKDDYVVDMVPACVDDDKIQNPKMAGNGQWNVAFRPELGQAFPLMLLDTVAGEGQGMATIAMASLSDLNNLCSQGTEVSIVDDAFYSPDPRYNYAPENWFRQSGDISATAWQSVNGGAFGDSGQDIFFATSDAGYLQSVYELSNIPYITNLGKGNGTIKGSRMDIPSGGTTIPTARDNTCHKNLFWLNYDPMFNDPINVESNLLFHTSYQGQRVNPYSDNMEVIRGVFANTPLDWKRASTNVEYTASSDCAGTYFDNISGFNSKYTWSTANSQETAAQISTDVMEDFAEAFIKDVRNNYNSKNWDIILADLMNDTTSKTLGKIDLGNACIYKSDRDFLYGYWRDCFAVRQQLYLVFVRAEPLMMGGVAAGATPPQLGGRAVALVWRDPTAVGNKNTSSECSGYPHPVRILFYKNLE